MTLRNVFDSCVKSWQYFRTHGTLLISDDIVRFKIEVGVEGKCMYKNVTLNTQDGDASSKPSCGE